MKVTPIEVERAKIKYLQAKEEAVRLESRYHDMLDILRKQAYDNACREPLVPLYGADLD